MSKKAILIGAVCIPLVAALGRPDRRDRPWRRDLAVADRRRRTRRSITTASGLKYVELKVGDGTEAKKGSKVVGPLHGHAGERQEVRQQPRPRQAVRPLTIGKSAR